MVYKKLKIIFLVNSNKYIYIVCVTICVIYIIKTWIAAMTTLTQLIIIIVCIKVK